MQIDGYPASKGWCPGFGTSGLLDPRPAFGHKDGQQKPPHYSRYKNGEVPHEHSF